MSDNDADGAARDPAGPPESLAAAAAGDPVPPSLLASLAGDGVDGEDDGGGDGGAPWLDRSDGEDSDSNSDSDYAGDDDDDDGRRFVVRRDGGWGMVGALSGVCLWAESYYGPAMRAARWALQPLAVGLIGYMAYAVFTHVLPLLHRVIEARRFAPHHHGSPWGVPAIDAAYALAAYLLAATVYAFARAAFVSPGVEPRPPPPPPEGGDAAAAAQPLSAEEERELAELLGGASTAEFCVRCWAPRAPRSHHCRVTGRCVRRFDHYCPWLGAPVGARNRAAFLGLLWHAGAGGAYAGALALSVMLLAPAALHGQKPPPPVYSGSGGSWFPRAGDGGPLSASEWLHLLLATTVGLAAGISLLAMAAWWTFLAARGYTSPEFARAVARRGLWAALTDPYAAQFSCGGPIDNLCEFIWGSAALRAVSGYAK